MKAGTRPSVFSISWYVAFASAVGSACAGARWNNARVVMVSVAMVFMGISPVKTP